MNEKPRESGPLISVIVPVYNAGEYLRECVDSLLDQTYEPYEILLVDDGSTDDSPEVVEEYGKSDRRVRVFHKTNGGLCDARNYGIARAAGDYITFVDSDDCVSNDYLTYLYGLIERFQVPLAIALMTNKKSGLNSDEVPAERRLGACEAIEMMIYPYHFGYSACAKIYQRGLLDENAFPKGMLYEDRAVMHRFISEAGEVAYGSRPIYYYRPTQGGITKSRLTEKHYEDGMKAVHMQKAFIDEHYPEIGKAADFGIVTKLIGFIHLILDGSAESRRYYRKIRRELRPLLKDVMRSGKVPLSYKIRCLAAAANYPSAGVIWRLYDKARSQESS